MMEFKKIVKLFIMPSAVMVLLTLMSCGEKKDSNKELRKPPGLQANCKLDGKELEQFASKEIPAAINCVKENLNIFISVVKPSDETIQTTNKNKKDKMLSAKDLALYIQKYEPQLQSVNKYLTLFFHFSHLVYGDPIGYLSQKNLNSMAATLIILNRELAHIYPVLNEKLTATDHELYAIHLGKRDILVSSAKKIAQSFLSQFKSFDGDVKEEAIQIVDILDIFKNANNQNDLAKLSKIFFLKRIIAGGATNTINQDELKYIFTHLPDLTHLLYDALKFSHLVFSDEGNRYQLLGDDLNSLQQVMKYIDEPRQYLFSMTELIDALKTYQDDLGFEIDKYVDLIPEFKSIFGDNTELDFVQNDFNKIISHLKSIIKIGSSFNEIYEENKDLILSSESLKEMTLQLTNPKLFNEFAAFNNIVKNYRYFKGNTPIPFFGEYFKRNIRGIIEVGMIEYVIKIVASFYEQNYPCYKSKFFIRPRPEREKKNCSASDWDDIQQICTEDLRCKGADGVATAEDEDYKSTLTQGQIELIFTKLSKPLTDLDIVTPGREFSASESAILLTDLFQLQSNDNGLVEVTELSELAVQILSALSMRKNVLDSIIEDCPAVNPKEKDLRFNATCVREHLFSILQKQFEYTDNETDIPRKYIYEYVDYLPIFAQFYEGSTPDVQGKFILKMEEFTRTCYYYDKNGDFPKSDVLAVVGGLFNVESTMARFDTDPFDGKLTGIELEKAYAHFEKAVVGILDMTLKDQKQFKNIVDWLVERIGKKVLAKKIFYYMVKNNKTPQGLNWDLIKFLLKKNYKDGISADRLTITSVLAAIKAQSPNKATQKELERVCKF